MILSMDTSRFDTNLNSEIEIEEKIRSLQVQFAITRKTYGGILFVL